MRNGCLEEGVLQGYLDGELSSGRAKSAANHIASCLSCAAAVEQASAESLMFSEAFAAELSLSVPTERLRARLDSEITRLTGSPLEGRKAYPLAGLRNLLDSLPRLLKFTPGRVAMASGILAIVIAIGIVGLVRFERQQPGIAQVPTESVANSSVPPAHADLVPDGRVTGPPIHKQKLASSDRMRFVRTSAKDKAPAVNQTERFLPGEKSYLRAIAKLKGVIEDPGEPIMQPTLRFEYERNLAVVDKAIAATRMEAKRNPNDPDASEFMLLAYQSKVDLLNTVAEQARLSPSGR